MSAPQQQPPQQQQEPPPPLATAAMSAPQQQHHHQQAPQQQQQQQEPPQQQQQQQQAPRQRQHHHEQLESHRKKQSTGGVQDIRRYPHMSYFAFELEVEEMESSEIILSELHPRAFPKRRQKHRAEAQAAHLAAARAKIDLKKAGYRETARLAYESVMAQARWVVPTAEARYRSDPTVAAEARLLAVKAAGGANNDPKAGWHKHRDGYCGPGGERVRDWRDLRKFAGADLTRWRESGLEDSDFDFTSSHEKNDRVLPLEVEAQLDAMWATADRAPYLRAESDERRDLRSCQESAPDRARAAAVEAARTAGALDPEAVVEALYPTAGGSVPPETGKKTTPPSGESNAAAPARPVLANAKVLQGGVGSRGQMMIKSKLKRPPPKPPAPAPPPPKKPAALQSKEARRMHRYNVVERLERLFGGGELAESVDADSDDDEAQTGVDADSYYDSGDSFIDDSDMIEVAEQRAESRRTKPANYTGFFASAGDLETDVAENTNGRAAQGKTLQGKRKLTPGPPTPAKRAKSSDSLSSVDVKGMIARDAPCRFNPVNPKRGESALRYDKYKAATTITMALDMGASRADIRNDYLKGHLVVDLPPVDSQGSRDAGVLPPSAAVPSPVRQTQQHSRQKNDGHHPDVDDVPPPPPPLAASVSSLSVDRPVATLKPKPKAGAKESSGAKPPRRTRCGACAGCQAPECGVCKFCLDRPKRGGQGRLRRPCIAKKCLAPVLAPAEQKTPRHHAPSKHKLQSPPPPGIPPADVSSNDFETAAPGHGALPPTSATAAAVTRLPGSSDDGDVASTSVPLHNAAPITATEEPPPNDA